MSSKHSNTQAGGAKASSRPTQLAESMDELRLVNRELAVLLEEHLKETEKRCDLAENRAKAAEERVEELTQFLDSVRANSIEPQEAVIEDDFARTHKHQTYVLATMTQAIERIESLEKEILIPRLSTEQMEASMAAIEQLKRTTCAAAENKEAFLEAWEKSIHNTHVQLRREKAALASKTRDPEQYYRNEIWDLQRRVRDQSEVISELQTEKSSLESNLQEAEEMQNLLQQQLAIAKKVPSSKPKDPRIVQDKNGKKIIRLFRDQPEPPTRIPQPTRRIPRPRNRRRKSFKVAVRSGQFRTVKTVVEDNSVRTSVSQNFAYSIPLRDASTWIASSLALVHYSPLRTAFKTFTPCDVFRKNVVYASNVRVLGVGKVELWLVSPAGRHFKHVLNSVYYVPSEEVSMLSLSSLEKENGVAHASDGRGRMIFRSSEGQQVGHALLMGSRWSCATSPGQKSIYKNSVTVHVDPEEELQQLRDVLELKNAAETQAQHRYHSNSKEKLQLPFLREDQARSLIGALVTGCRRRDFGTLQLQDMVDMILDKVPSIKIDDQDKVVPIDESDKREPVDDPDEGEPLDDSDKGEPLDDSDVGEPVDDSDEEGLKGLDKHFTMYP